MQSSFLKRLLVSSALASFAMADYYIDDQNFTSLVYSENPGGAKWGPFQEGGETLSISLANGTMMTVDASRCFNYTYTCKKSPGHVGIASSLWSIDAACTVADDCQVQIPFTGSGITVYVLQAGAQGINASLTIDGGAPKYNVLPAPPGPSFYVPNVTLFSIQGIATGNHTATMTVLNWDNIFSGMMFDYALVNQTVVSRTTATTALSSTTTASTTPDPTTTGSSPSSSTHIGAIVGGVVGGLAALAVVLFAIFYLPRRRRRQVLSANLDAEPKIEPFLPVQLYHDRPERYADVAHPSTTESLVTGSVTAPTLPYSTISGSSRRAKSQMAITNPSASQIASANAVSTSPAGSASVSSPGVSEASRPRIQQEHPMLTDDQADFVNNLYANNVPAGAIARVIERMIAGERQPVVDGYDSLPPPSYYYTSGDA